MHSIIFNGFKRLFVCFWCQLIKRNKSAILCQKNIIFAVFCKDNKMISLNLPPFNIKLSGTKQQPKVFDVLRRKYVTLTPEEWVRQHFIHYLINNKNYPVGLLANEVKLSLGEKTMRADSVLYNHALKPIVVMEYKAPTVAITERVFTQITSYNTLLQVEFLIVSNGLQHYCCRVNKQNNTYEFLEHIPSYEELITTLK